MFVFSEGVTNVLESIADSFLVIDANWRLIYMNGVSRRNFSALGRNPKELIGKHFWEEVVPDARGTIAEREYNRAMNERVPVHYECFFEPWQRWLDVRAFPVEDDGISVYFRDITDHKLAAERERRAAADALEAARANAKFRTIFEQGSYFASVLDLDGTIIDANHLCVDACGFTREEVIGKKFWDCGWWNHSPELKEIIREGTRQAAAGQKFRRELEYFAADGSKRCVDMVIAPARDDAGNVMFILPSGRDITERKQAERALRETSSRYESLFNSIDEGFCVIEVLFDESNRPYDYRFLEINPAFEKQTGLKQAAGKRMRELAPGHEEHWFETYGTVALTGKPKRFVNQASALDRWFDVFAFRVGEPEQHRVAILFKDITERKEAQEALKEARNALARQNQMLDQTVQERTAQLQETIMELEAFSYSISHDMRSPLRAMQGYADTLLHDYRDKLDVTAIHYLERIHKASSRLDLLVREVLAYSRVAKGQIELKPVDLEHVISEIIQNYPNLNASKIHVVVSHLPLVIGHEGLLTQIVSNLLGNSVKFFTPGKFPEVRISAETKGDEVKVWLEDNGIGIAPQHHQQIFEIFGRVHPEKKYEGAGIGLAIVKKAAERMGGSAGVESELGKGSRFWITLNKARESESKADLTHLAKSEGENF